jgi:DDE superfamily endonuclease/Helix-turn-helix of DDE superfamily endonuclease
VLTVASLQQYPGLVKALTGLPAEEFWALVTAVTARWAAHQRARRARPGRRRAVGGGRRSTRPLALRVAVVLTYLRPHVPQGVVGWLFGTSQAAVSRALHEVLPVLRACLPCPAIWEPVAAAEALPAEAVLTVEQVAGGRALIDATEQRVARPGEDAVQKRYYSGKKQQHTLKTQLVADGEHQIRAISRAVPGATHDKTLCDAVRTVDRLPDGVEGDADKGYQGLAAQVETVAVCDVATRQEQCRPRVTIQTPHKKPRGGELTDEQRQFNRRLGAIRIRIEHCLGWLKNWAILATPFRCAHDRYTLIMCVICGLVNAQTARWQVARAAQRPYSE